MIFKQSDQCFQQEADSLGKTKKIMETELLLIYAACCAKYLQSLLTLFHRYTIWPRENLEKL